MPEYISKFLTVAIRQLLRGEGQAFINEYYSYLEKIYNLRIPLRDIATKGKIKKSIEEYKKDIKEITKAGRPKSRQAWYELAIQNNLHVDNGDTLYYINTGKSKSESDVKKITHYCIINDNQEKVEVTKEIDKRIKEYKKGLSDSEKKAFNKKKWMDKEYPNLITEEEIIMNCTLVPRNIIDAETDTFCEDGGIEYNVNKYIDMFNKRITPLLVCFSREIREQILVTNPEDRKYFTEEQCKLSSGEPNKVSDQDTYEQLMTMEDKEIKFWTKYDLIPPFVEECRMGKWEDIKADYLKRMEDERKLGIDKERETYDVLLQNVTEDEVDELIEDGTLPDSISKLVDIDPLTNNLISKKFENVVLGTINDIIDKDFSIEYDDMKNEE